LAVVLRAVVFCCTGFFRVVVLRVVVFLAGFRAFALVLRAGVFRVDRLDLGFATMLIHS